MKSKIAFLSVFISGICLNPVRFALWMLRDEAAQRQLALRGIQYQMEM
jgi:hypothetical protein